MRRSLCLFLLVALALLSGCSSVKREVRQDAHIYATFYPLFAAAGMISEDAPGVRLDCLVQPQDGCLRAYTLSDWDYALLRSADAVIAGGRGLESFEESLYSMGAQGPAVSTVLYNMPLSKADIDVADDEDSHWADANPHIYMKIDGMISICESIAAHLSVIDPSNARLYTHNLEKAKNRLESLRAEMHAIASETDQLGIIVMNEALLYVAEEYNMDVRLCVNRDSGEAYYDVELEKCLEKLDQCGGKIVLIERQAPKAFVEALEDAGYAVARMDIMSTHRADEDFEAYFTAQLENARALSEAAKTTPEALEGDG